MKKILMSALLVGALVFPAVPSQATGFPVTDIPRLIFEYIQNKVLMEKDEKVQKQKLEKLLQTLKEVKQIRARQTEQLDMDVDIDQELWKVRQYKELSMSDLRRLAEKIIRVSTALYANDLPTLTEYHLLKQAVPGIQSSNQMYEFLQGGTSAYAVATGLAARDYSENMVMLSDQRAKQYALEIESSQRAMHTAMTYQQVSTELADQAMDLSAKISKDGSWNMFGIGNILSDLNEILSGDVLGDGNGLEGILNNLGGKLTEQVEDLGKKIKKETGMNDSFIDKILGGGKNDVSNKIMDKVTSNIEGLDALSGILSLFSGVVNNLSQIPSYTTRIEKEGLKMTTGERIEAQAAALDNMERSFDLQLQADQMIIEASNKSQTMERLDAAYQNALVRKELTRMSVE
ncbi:hypothetical protein [Xanthocytophaga agilis]|uniref:Conjugal transfer protein n=1 Tax=Xanthocytophaga agilis TaxID=3048010 RepID=A0AAE3UJ10_9BACT|nr:hypothetical protein [Xanthocytophaga agilis]MDJ1505232.1 hypothetical protein [Xanthocytophaga agilis]